MSKKYCLVENGVVVREPMELPHSWGNISNFPALSDEELLELGWYLFIDLEDLKPYQRAGQYIVGASSVTNIVSNVNLDTYRSIMLTPLFSLTTKFIESRIKNAN